jgi:hypothetical protein
MRYEVLPGVNCQLRGFDENVDVFSQMERTEKDHTLFEDRESELRTMDNKVTGED